MAELYAQALEAAGYKVTRNLGLGSRQDRAPAFEAGQVDLVPEYVGSGLGYYNKQLITGDGETNKHSLQAVLAAKGNLATVLGITPGQDTNAAVVRQDTATSMSLAKMSDLAAHQDDLRWGLPPDCDANPLCKGALETYGIKYPPKQREALAACDAPIATALQGNAIDFAWLCSTQPAIAQNGFVLLEDDLKTQPAENIAPLVRDDSSPRWTGRVPAILDAVSAKMTTEELTKLGVEVDVDNEDVADVAKQWLTDQGLLSSPRIPREFVRAPVDDRARSIPGHTMDGSTLAMQPGHRPGAQRGWRATCWVRSAGFAGFAGCACRFADRPSASRDVAADECHRTGRRRQQQRRDVDDEGHRERRTLRQAHEGRRSLPLRARTCRCSPGRTARRWRSSTPRQGGPPGRASARCPPPGPLRRSTAPSPTSIRSRCRTVCTIVRGRPATASPSRSRPERPGERRPLGEPGGDPFRARQPVGRHRGSHTQDQEGRDGEAHEDRRRDDPTHPTHQDRERGDGRRRQPCRRSVPRPPSRGSSAGGPPVRSPRHVAAHQLAEARRQDVVREIADEQRNRGRRSPSGTVGDRPQEQPPADRPQGRRRAR